MTTMCELWELEPDKTDGKIHLTKEQFDFLKGEMDIMYPVVGGFGGVIHLKQYEVVCDRS